MHAYDSTIKTNDAYLLIRVELQLGHLIKNIYKTYDLILA